MKESIIVSFAITPEELQRLYDGSARSVYTVAADGRSVSFPLRILQPFITRDGIRGAFRIWYQDGRFEQIERLSA
ncbi:DUF2835 family protein [Natronospirillum operosum]|uniref:DUF2835 family protein n=1 Tax=Natronospirillum operosum TaxID=2759953 RepID=A0A4Z0WJR4_9GAMM|nr:DUF2835 family protein [Natronospirillum operosum]TGG95741.1 DUF2835 family protein [Natronospirillum operosum]